VIVLHQYEISPFCDKVRRAMNYKGVPYELRNAPLSRTPLHARRVNPVGKLPTIEDDGTTIADSTNILLWLEERFPEPALYPSDRVQAALAHVLEDWADESLYFYEMTMRVAWRDNAERWLPSTLGAEPAWFRPIAPRVLAAVLGSKARKQGIAKKTRESVVEDMERHVAALAALLGGDEWLVGATLTIADIAVVAQLTCIAMSAEGERVLEAHEDVIAWMGRVDAATQRPA
jgi:glutathione S-transferase